MKRIALITEDKYLFRKCSILLEGIAELSDTPEGASLIAIQEQDAGGKRQLKITDSTGVRHLTLPSKLSDLLEALTPSQGGARLSISTDARLAYLDGDEIKLTESEGALLSFLISGDGDFVSRDKILSSVFPEKSAGIINVYIHYLREKLEKNGEKIITASREAGYRIEKRFLGGKA